MGESQGPARGYSWPTLTPGHEVTLRHGARSPAKVGALAEDIEQQARTSPSWPAYLQGAEYRAAVTAWARAEAVAELLWLHMAGRDVDDVLADVSEETSTETRERGQPAKRVTSARRTRAALDWFQRAERSAALHRQRLGLDPLSRAKLGKDVAVSAVQAGLAQMQQDGAELLARARASGALPETPTTEESA